MLTIIDYFGFLLAVLIMIHFFIGLSKIQLFWN